MPLWPILYHLLFLTLWPSDPESFTFSVHLLMMTLSPYHSESFISSWLFYLSILAHLSSADPDSFIFLSWLFHPLFLTLISFYPSSPNFWSWLFRLFILNLSPSPFIFWCCLFFFFSSWLFYFILTFHASTISCIIHLLILTLSSFYPDSFIYCPGADSFPSYPDPFTF